MTIGLFVGAGSLFLLRWSGTKGSFSFMMAVLLLGGAAVMFVVKAAENIERAEFRGYDPVGKTGYVTVAIGKASCSVRVDGLDWSATSKGELRVGEEVVVVRREGVHVFVKKRETQSAG